jgi:hypothetical protein
MDPNCSGKGRDLKVLKTLETLKALHFENLFKDCITLSIVTEKHVGSEEIRNEKIDLFHGRVGDVDPIVSDL